MVVEFLEFQRATLSRKCEGLNSEDARSHPCPPSTLSLVGIVRHLTDVERMWFSARFLGREPGLLYRREDTPAAAFNELETADLAASLERWEQACEESRAIVSAHSFDEIAASSWHGDDHPTLRWIVCHLVEEYARHNGHADLLREAIDGSVGV